jgi:hypothetical protein
MTIPNAATASWRTSALKLSTWVVLAAGLLVFAGDFLGSDRTFAALYHAFHESMFIILLACLLFSQVGHSEYVQRSSQRILELEKENAALRAKAAT